MSSINRTRAWALWRQHRSLLIFLGLMLCFRSAWADWVAVPTGSMNPTVLEGDRLLIDKHVYGIRVPFTLRHITTGKDPVRGEIVVFDSPVDGTSLVKRVIGVPGDHIEMDGEALIVNGVRAQYAEGDAARLRGILQATAAEDPIVLRETGLAHDHDVMLLPRRMQDRRVGPLTVPEGTYFMLGDNRDNSGDSRYFGFVPRKNIVGRATRVVVSLNPDRHYAPRGDRFLAPLN